MKKRLQNITCHTRRTFFGLKRVFGDLSPRLFINWWCVWKTLPVLSWIRAAQCFRRGDFGSAILFYQKGLKTHPNHKAAECARLDYGYCLYRMKDIRASKQELRGLLESGSVLKEAFLLLAKLELATGELARAKQTMESALALYPEDLQTVVRYANTVIVAPATPRERQKIRTLLITLKSELSLEDIGSLLVDAALAGYEIRYGERSDGEQLLARVIAAGNAPFEAILLRGTCLLENGRVIAAREQLRRALALSPRDPRPQALLAKSYLGEGTFFEPEWAIQLATSACAHSGWENAEFLRILVDSYAAFGDDDTAELFARRMKQQQAKTAVDTATFEELEEQLRSLRAVKVSSY